MNVQEINTAEEKTVESTESSRFVAPNRQYVEVPARPGREVPVDGLNQLAANISTLENLQSQMSFMMRELRSLNIKSR